MSPFQVPVQFQATWIYQLSSHKFYESMEKRELYKK